MGQKFSGVICLLVIVGESRAAGLFGDIFPPRDVIISKNFAEIDDQNAAVIVSRASVVVKNAAGVIFEDDGESEISAPRGIQLITCGRSGKDAVCVTSRTAEKLTLSLNRAIKTKLGVCEPLELPLPLREEFSEFDIMAAFAAKLLLDGEIL